MSITGTIDNISVYVICLEREAERREFIDAIFEKLSVKPKYVGLDGSQLPEKYSRLYGNDDAESIWGRALTHGEIGCYASHMDIWQKIVDGRDDFALVLESDALLTMDTLEIVELITKKYSDIDLAMLSWGDCVPSFWGARKMTRKYKLVRFARKSYFSSAYLLSNHGAKELIKHSKKITMPVDEHLCGEQVKKDMEIYAVYPAVVSLIPDSDATSILKNERDFVRGSDAPGKKTVKIGLKQLEPLVRHFFIRLARPPKV